MKIHLSVSDATLGLSGIRSREDLIILLGAVRPGTELASAPHSAPHAQSRFAALLGPGHIREQLDQLIGPGSRSLEDFCRAANLPDTEDLHVEVLTLSELERSGEAMPMPLTPHSWRELLGAEPRGLRWTSAGFEFAPELLSERAAELMELNVALPRGTQLSPLLRVTYDGWRELCLEVLTRGGVPVALRAHWGRGRQDGAFSVIFDASALRQILVRAPAHHELLSFGGTDQFGAPPLILFGHMRDAPVHDPVYLADLDDLTCRLSDVYGAPADRLLLGTPEQIAAIDTSEPSAAELEAAEAALAEALPMPGSGELIYTLRFPEFGRWDSQCWDAP